MRRILLAILVVGAAGVGLVAAGNVDLGPVVITPEDEQKIILLLGDPRTVTEPGWTLRVPLLENVRSTAGACSTSIPSRFPSRPRTRSGSSWTTT